MNRPKMILFDYGHTLVYEPSENDLASAEIALEHAVKNPHRATAKQISRMGASLFDEQARILRPNDMEVSGLKLDTLVYELLGLEFDIAPLELEYQRWVAAEPIIPMDGICELLVFLNREGIRTGVISNLSHTGEVLKRRIDDVLPMNTFEFIISSNDYVYRKPNRHLFDLAIEKARLEPDEIWFCGDDIVLDVEGAHHVGMFPVWYESPLECTYKKRPERKPGCDNFHIQEWNELLMALKMQQEALIK